MNALQNALDAIDCHPTDELSRAKATALIRGYDHAWGDHDYIATSVEETITGPIQNPETGRPARVFGMAGKVDVIAIKDGQSVLIDHKTTSMDIEEPDATYWRQLAVESQVDHYMLLAWLNGRKIDNAVWDVIRKPGIKPKKLTKADMKATLESGHYCGFSVTTGDRVEIEATGRETYDMYSRRLEYDCTHERPGRYFQRRSVPRMDAEILEYANELWLHSKDILAEQKKNLPQRNSGACMNYGTPCPFLGVCSGHDSIASDHWRRKECVHTELPDISGDGKDVLTNSRIRCFQTCRRKAYYKYDLGIERVDAEEPEALTFGTLIHVGLEAWWNTFLPGESNGNCNVPQEAELAV